MARIEIRQDFPHPVHEVYAHLAEHENLGPLFGAKVERVRDGRDSRNGVGSTRRMKVGPLPEFEETVIAAEPDEMIEYRISKGTTPLRDHRGELRFASSGTGSTVVWTIEFGAVLPLLDRLIAVGLERSIRSGLRSVAARPSL